VIPVAVITGFLGSGKSTLLSRMLPHPALADAAVIINEFGEIGLDHHLVERVEGDVVVMSSGCLCCTIRNDLADTLRGLYEKREAGAITKFRRVIVETTGLADPAPILHTLMDEPFARRYFRLDGVITTVDALHGMGQLDEHLESVKQVAVADRLVLTKTDLASASAVDALRARLRTLNPGAAIFQAVRGDLDPAVLFDAGLYDPQTKSEDVRRWLNAEAVAQRHGHAHDVNRHDARIQAHCLVFDATIDWRYFSPNLASFVSRNANKLLRVKGLLNVKGEPLPVVVHGVQHQFQRMRLARWPDDDRRSRLVLITRDLERAAIESWLQPHKLSGEPPVDS
jgi:G3E family GTPase